MDALFDADDELEEVPVVAATRTLRLADWMERAPRLWERVVCCPDGSPAASAVLGGCWFWTGAVSSTGHGKFALRRTILTGAHNLAWVVTHRQLMPAGMVVRHRCDEPLCVRPDHLVAGTQLDNIDDRVRRGRVWAADVRGPADRSKAIRAHLLAHPEDWEGLAAVIAAGDPNRWLSPLPGV